ncbi:hypothetical protein O181_097487 [Austropuccinia psidii MF-1]|uniref:Uncharacterized protein n=1 Tax=Austropuccinia psidii MF-1 TaxID=1389203 RepID=A0A9Q3J8M7_9BASI|nr:hypothetical protein [Austropuccinia psidii MF-1]
MPVQHTPPAKNTRSQRHQAALTPTASYPPYCTPSVHQLSSNLDRGQPMEVAAPSRRWGVKLIISRSFCGLLDCYPRNSKGPRIILVEAEDEEWEESVKEEESEDTEVVASLACAPGASCKV